MTSLEQAVRKVLKYCYITYAGNTFCAICRNSIDRGHMPDCPIPQLEEELQQHTGVRKGSDV